MLCIHTIIPYFKSPLAETDVGNFPTRIEEFEQLKSKGEIEITLEILQPIGEVN